MRMGQSSSRVRENPLARRVKVYEVDLTGGLRLPLPGFFVDRVEWGGRRAERAAATLTQSLRGLGPASARPGRWSDEDRPWARAQLDLTEEAGLLDHGLR
jgi:hypothetical protein